MTNQRQKQDEDNAVVNFMQLADALGIRGSFERLEPPNPDFVLRLEDGSRIGLEVTDATRSDVAEHVALVNKLATELREQMNARHLTGRVHLSFSPPLETPDKLRAEVKRAAKQIVDWVAQQNGKAAAISQAGENDAGAHWAATFGLIGLRQVELTPGPFASIMRGRSYDGNDRACVVRALSNKEAKLPRYKTVCHCVQYWLLVVAGTSFADPNWDMIDDYAEFRSSFDRVFFLEHGRSEPTLNELQIRKP
jgi:hypothetical protein